MVMELALMIIQMMEKARIFSPLLELDQKIYGMLYLGRNLRSIDFGRIMKT